jgi:hypothetical protein
MLAFSVIPVVTVTYWGFSFLQVSFERASLHGLEALTKAKAESVDQFTEMRRRDVERIAGLMAPHLLRLRESERAVAARQPAKAPEPERLPKLKDAEDFRPEGKRAAPEPDDGEANQAGTATPPPQQAPTPEAKAVEEALQKLRQTLGLVLWDQRDFEELLLIDPEGRVVASTYDGHQSKTAEGLEYFKQGRKATFVQTVFLSPITEQLTMVIAAPMRDEQLNEVGVLAARLNLNRFFRLINDSTGLGKTGETVVAKMIDEKIVFMAPTRHDAKAALSRTIPVGSDQATALQEAARGQSGIGVQVDYRGKKSFAAWQYVPSLDWGLQSKIDYEEGIDAAAEVRDRILTLTLFLLLLVIPASLLTAGRSYVPCTSSNKPPIG